MVKSRPLCHKADGFYSLVMFLAQGFEMKKVLGSLLLLLVANASHAFEMKAESIVLAQSFSGSFSVDGVGLEGVGFEQDARYMVTGSGRYELSGVYSGSIAEFFIGLQDNGRDVASYRTEGRKGGYFSTGPFDLLGGTSYQLVVRHGGSSSWSVGGVISPVPLPGAVWLFGSAFAGLIGLGRFRSA